MFKVFYSWQSDLAPATNRWLLLEALEKACKELRAQNSVVVEPTVDRDTLGVAGAVNIAETIFAKILDADVFVADVSLVNTAPLNSVGAAGKLLQRLLGFLHLQNNIVQRPSPNPNVLLELGYAKRHLGDEAIVLVANTYYGSVEQLPFDLRGLRTLTHHTKPSEATAAGKKKELISAFKGAIKSIATVLREDPVLAVIHPKTLNVAGQTEGMLLELIKAAGKQFDPRHITKSELGVVCSSVNPCGQAPLIIGRDAAGGFQNANWILYLIHWRNRSRTFTRDILMFSPFLKAEHVTLLAVVEQCSYFVQLESLAGQQVLASDLGFLTNLMWGYVEATRRLRDYAERILARRVVPF